MSSENSDEAAHLRSLIRIFTGRVLDSHGCKLSSVDAQADLCLYSAHL